MKNINEKFVEISKSLRCFWDNNQEFSDSFAVASQIPELVINFSLNRSWNLQITLLLTAVSDCYKIPFEDKLFRCRDVLFALYLRQVLESNILYCRCCGRASPGV